MSDLNSIDHVMEALARVTDQFSDAARLQALISVLVAPFQDVESTLQQLYTQRWAENAVGVQLDNVGAIVGQPRNGQDDATYRLWITARQIVDRSAGSYDDHLRVLDLIAAGAVSSIDEYPPCSYVVNVEGLLIDIHAVWQILHAIKPEGWRMFVVYNPAPVAAEFTLDGHSAGTNGTVDNGTGFGNSSDSSIGGQFSQVIES